jgi:hypothetical protein
MAMFKRMSRSQELPILGNPNNPCHNPYSPRAVHAPQPNIKLGLMAFLLLLPWIPYVTIRVVFRKAESHVSYLLDQRHSVAQALTDQMQVRQSLKDKERTIHDETGALFSILRNAGAMEDYEAHEKVEERYLDQINIMQAHIQTSSRRAVKERYGSGPYKVAIDLQVWDHVSTIVVEDLDMARMPHAINVFLDMVTEKVWEGATMTSNQRELTVSVPLSPDNDNRINQIHKRTLAFSETSLSRSKYSLCFKDLGPTLHISLQETIEGTCFGTVTDNQELRLDRLPAAARVINMRLLSLA